MSENGTKVVWQKAFAWVDGMGESASGGRVVIGADILILRYTAGQRWLRLPGGNCCIYGEKEFAESVTDKGFIGFAARNAEGG
jgi:hypothetical protein